MKNSELLEVFADIATSVYEEGLRYSDISDPENMRAALDFYNEQLGFLVGRDRQDLLNVWHHACDDPRNTKMFMNAVRVLKEKYE
jgi:hypothetical protein